MKKNTQNFARIGNSRLIFLAWCCKIHFWILELQLKFIFHERWVKMNTCKPIVSIYVRMGSFSPYTSEVNWKTKVYMMSLRTMKEMWKRASFIKINNLNCILNQAILRISGSYRNFSLGAMKFNLQNARFFWWFCSLNVGNYNINVFQKIKK